MRTPWIRGTCAAAGIAMLMCGVSCGTSPKNRQQVLMEDMRVTYKRAMTDVKPAYVVITYPESVQALPEIKQLEYRAVQSVLDELGIPSDCKRYADALTKWKGKRGVREYVGYYLPEHLAKKYQKETVIFLNLGLGETQKTTYHPNCKEHNVVVRIMTDPVDFAASS